GADAYDRRDARRVGGAQLVLERLGAGGSVLGVEDHVIEPVVATHLDHSGRRHHDEDAVQRFLARNARLETGNHGSSAFKMEACGDAPAKQAAGIGVTSSGTWIAQPTWSSRSHRTSRPGAISRSVRPRSVSASTARSVT